MSRTFHHGKYADRQIRVRGVRREEPDLRRLARAIIEFAAAEAEAEMHGETRKAESVAKPERCRQHHPGDGANEGSEA